MANVPIEYQNLFRERQARAARAAAPKTPKARPAVTGRPALAPEDAVLAARYPDFLLRPHANGLSEEALAAKNIRVLLKTTYPGIKFSVTSDGNTVSASVRVAWDAFPDAPNDATVRAITRVFKAGSVNTMDDSYTYSQDLEHKAFGRLFGSVEFVSVSSRRVTQAMIVEREAVALRKEMAKVKPAAPEAGSPEETAPTRPRPRL